MLPIEWHRSGYRRFVRKPRATSQVFGLVTFPFTSHFFVGIYLQETIVLPLGGGTSPKRPCMYTWHQCILRSLLSSASSTSDVQVVNWVVKFGLFAEISWIAT